MQMVERDSRVLLAICQSDSNKFLTHLPACVFKWEIYAISRVFVNNNNDISTNGNLSVSSSKRRMSFQSQTRDFHQHSRC